MESLLRDLRYSIRTLFHNPGFAVVALLSLALGIGANTTIFSVFASIIFRPFPVSEPDRLVVLEEIHRERGRSRVPSYTTFLELKKQSQVIEDWALTDWGAGPMTLSGLGKAERISVGDVGPNFFTVVGVQPVLGRSFENEFSGIGLGESDTVVISHGLWQRFFNADPNVLGQTVFVEGFKKTVIGVMPSGFWIFPWAKDTDLWLAHDLSLTDSPDFRWLRPIARLKPGITLEQARAEMDVISQRVEGLDSETNEGWSLQIERLREWADRGNFETLYLLMGVVGFILLIACANVANLLLARATTREKEIALRAALGAHRRSLLRQTLTESLLLAVLGGVFGVLLSFIGVRIFVLMAPTWVFDVEEISIDSTVLAFTLGISLLAGLLFGVFPALRVSKVDLHEFLKEGGRSSRSSGGRSRNALVVAEVALALVLLVGAGLMANSFLRLQGVDSGFNPENVLAAEVFLAGTNYWDYAEGDLKRVTPQGLLFYEQVLEKIRAFPGVVSASTVGRVPPSTGRSRFIEIVGRPTPAEGEPLRVYYCEVSPGFFETLEIPLLAGRYLDDQDLESSPWVVVINETMAKQFFPDENPIGKSLYMSVPHSAVGGKVEEGRPREIVGIVEDVKRWSVRRDGRPHMYGSHKQHLWEFPGGQYTSHLQKDFVIRTAIEPMSVARDLQKIVAEVDSSQAVYNIRTMEQALADMLAPERFWMQLYGIFAAFAVILAAVGIYGVMSYSVSQRTHEFGVRMAVGAHKVDVLKLVIKHGLKLTVIGLVVGLGASYWLTSLVSRYLYGVTPTDPLTLAAVAIVLVMVTVAACYFPARWATKVDPLVALRYE